MVRCRFAFRRLASFSTARSISTSLRLAFCGALRVSDPRGSADLKGQRQRAHNSVWCGLQAQLPAAGSTAAHGRGAHASKLALGTTDLMK